MPSYYDKVFLNTKERCPDCGCSVFKKGRKFVCVRYPKCQGNVLMGKTAVDYGARKKRYYAHKKIYEEFGEYQYQWQQAHSEGKHIGDMTEKEIDELFIKIKEFKNNDEAVYVWSLLKDII